MEPEIPYRTPFNTSPAASVSSTDEHDFSTLLQVRNDFAAEIAKLHDFNAFEFGKDMLPADRAKKLLHEVEVNQAVYAILAPFFETLDSTIQDINSRYKER
jgi:hypothetical protein